VFDHEEDVFESMNFNVMEFFRIVVKIKVAFVFSTLF
jgi:hypothetical protein